MTGDLGKKLDAVLENPEMLSQIKALADTMTKGSTEKEAPQEKEEDTAVLKAGLSSLFHISPEMQKSLKDTKALLSALRPFLDRERCQKIDKMVSMLGLAEMAENLGKIL